MPDLSPAMLRLIEVLAELAAEDYLREQANTGDDCSPSRAEHPPLPDVNKAA